MRVKMLQDETAAPDGIHVERLRAGEIYEVPDFLASRYVESGIAEAKELSPSDEDKDAGRQPENKARRSRPRK